MHRFVFGEPEVRLMAASDAVPGNKFCNIFFKNNKELTYSMQTYLGHMK